MIIKINKYSFRQAFIDAGRQTQFSYDGLQNLFDWFELCEDGMDLDIELDVVGICCEFTEYEDLDEFHNEYSKEEYPDLETLMDYTQVIENNDGSFIIQNF
tara:strand:+ start:378 stop:680 length:303 start_codon:yes stop_codon:yes gene_type:complete